MVIAFGTLVLLLANATGRPGGSTRGTETVATVSYFLSSLAVLSETDQKLCPLSLFYYYRGHNPFVAGGHWPDVAVVVGFALGCLGLSLVAVSRRDLGA